MAVTQTTRLGISRWSAGTDPFERAQLDADHALLESKTGIFLSGLIGARPAASAALARAFYLSTDEQAPRGIVYYCDGTTWVSLNAYAAPSGTVNPGDTASAGTATTTSRSDHVHAQLAWGSVGDIAATGTSASAGVATKYARADHVHTVGTASVVAGDIAAGGVSASNQIANAIITTSHFGSGVVDKAAISADQQSPSGSVLMYVGTSAPTGYLFCDGTSYLTASYAALFAIIGYTYGGSGGNFNVPDFRTRLPRGAATPTTAGTLNVQGGNDSITITNIPAHVHGVGTLAAAAVADHAHTWSGTTGVNSVDHTHGFTATTGGMNSNTVHSHGIIDGANYSFLSYQNSGVQGGLVLTGSGFTYATSNQTLNANLDHSHNVTGATGGMSANHTHTVSGNTGNAGAHTPSLSGSTASAGPGGTTDITNKYTTINYIIKI